MTAIKVNPVINGTVRKLCYTPYPNHPKGCPNYGKRESCPPQAPYFKSVFDMSKPIYAIYNVFNLGEHVEKMWAKHPGWTDRQLRCVLYWQGTARKRLREKIGEFMLAHPEVDIVETCPEAMGVNVTATMAAVGIELEWPPVNVAYQIALAGTMMWDEMPCVDGGG